jgi:MASE1
VGDAKGMMIVMAKGLVLSIAYGIAYLVLRYFSFDQWFLPAGLRALCLFFLPLRYWPFVFVGDAAAVMYGRIPKAHKYDPAWVYAGPLLLITTGSIMPYLLRKKLGSAEMIVRRLPLAAACTAAWSAACTIGFNESLGGPSDNFSMVFIANNLFGNYLGILMVVLPALILARIARTYLKIGICCFSSRHPGERRDPAFEIPGKNGFRHSPERRRYEIVQDGFDFEIGSRHPGPLGKVFRDAALALVCIGAMLAYLEFWHGADDVVRKSVLMLMICPALFLTYYHGWIGAAIGVLLVNLGITLTMTYAGIPGAYDETAFLAQIGLSIAASAFLILGWRITSHYENAIDAGVAEEEARRISRLALLSNDDVARDHVLYMAQLYLLVEEEKRKMVHRLTAQGMHKEAFALNSQGVEHRKLFDQHVLALYPISIEEKGLFAVVQSQAFEDRWAAGAPLSIRFDDGDPKRLSVVLQLAVYRCLSSAIIMLRDWTPEEFRIRMRVWHTPSHRGVYFSVSACNPGQLEISQAGAAASLLLEATAHAHGGILHRHAHRVSVLLAEANR